MKELSRFDLPTGNESKNGLIAYNPLYFSDSSFVYTKLHGHSRKKLKKISNFFWWLLRYMSSPEQKIGFLIQLLKNPGQASGRDLMYTPVSTTDYGRTSIAQFLLPMKIFKTFSFDCKYFHIYWTIWLLISNTCCLYLTNIIHLQLHSCKTRSTCISPWHPYSLMKQT